MDVGTGIMWIANQERAAMRRLNLVAAAVATAVVLTGCGDPVSSSATPNSSDSPRPKAAVPPKLPAGLSGQDLPQFLPPVTLLEDLLGTELDEETLSDLSQLWEGKNPRTLNLAGFRTRKYRESAVTSGGSSAALAGGYVALTLFSSTEDAKKFATTTRVFRAEDVPDSGSYGDPIDLGAFADEGVGYTYTEDEDTVSGVAYLRMDRMIVEIALLGQPEKEYPGDLAAVAGYIREAVDQASG